MIKELSQGCAGVGPASLFPINTIWEEKEEKWGALLDAPTQSNRTVCSRQSVRS